MSEQVLERQSSESRNIPERHVVIKDPSELPTSYCSTPGGTIFSTTPGGTRIIYNRDFLLKMRNSPYTKTPPSKLAIIPDIVAEDVPVSPPEKVNSPEPATEAKNKDDTDHTMFSMED